MTRKVICSVCDRPIKTENELVVCWSLFSVYPCHNYCYGKEAREGLASLTVTGPTGNFIFYLALASGVYLLAHSLFFRSVFPAEVYWAILPAIGLIFMARAAGWYLFHRHLAGVSLPNK